MGLIHVCAAVECVCVWGSKLGQLSPCQGHPLLSTWPSSISLCTIGQTHMHERGLICAPRGPRAVSLGWAALDSGVPFLGGYGVVSWPLWPHAIFLQEAECGKRCRALNVRQVRFKPLSMTKVFLVCTLGKRLPWWHNHSAIPSLDWEGGRAGSGAVSCVSPEGPCGFCPLQGFLP